MALEAGSRLGQHEIKGLLGEGGMGQVYRARDPKLDRDVAIKVLPPELAGDSERIARFRREAKLLASLSHPNVAAIHGFDDDEDCHFLVMELVEGTSLDARLRQGALDLDEALELARQVAEGLESAHAGGIVHRDLKPANVMVRPDGQVKVLDFGLAKALVDDPELSGGLSQSPTLLTAETQQGVLLGTAAYMSPEQARGKAVDSRTDVWAFGCLLYEMLSGKRAFAGETISDTLANVLKGRADEDALGPEVPGRIRRLIRRCLVRDPRQRLQAIGDARIVLQEVIAEPDELRGEGIAPETSPFKRALPWLLMVIPIALSFLLGRGSLFGTDAVDSSPVPATRQSFTPTGMRPLTSMPGIEYTASWSPDGNLLVFAHGANGPLDIYVVPRVGGRPIALVQSPSDDIAPRWSPDGRWIAFVSNRDDRTSVHVVPPLGGAVRRLADTHFPTLDLGSLEYALGVQPWSADGKELTFSRSRTDQGADLVTLRLADGVERILTSVEVPGAFDRSAAFSWDGERMAYVRTLTSGGSELRVRLLEDGSERVIATSESAFGPPSWSPDGQRLLYGLEEKGFSGIWAIGVDGGEPSVVVLGPDFYDEAPVSRDGRVVVGTYSHVTDLYLQAIDGSELRRLTAHVEDNFEPQFSGDGSSLAYHSSRTGNGEIWRLDLQTGEEIPLTEDPAEDWGPDWSPTSDEVVFMTSRGGGTALWLVDEAGLRPRLLYSLQGGREEDLGMPRWSPDGQLVGVIQGQGINGVLTFVGLDGVERGDQVRNVQGFGWYRDSNRIIYTTGGTGDGSPSEMRARDLSSGEEVVLLQEPHAEIEVSSDGNAVSYCQSKSHYDMHLRLLRLSEPQEPGGLPRPSGEPEIIARGPGEWHVHNGGFSPDGRSVVYTRDTDSADLFELEGVFGSADGED